MTVTRRIRVWDVALSSVFILVLLVATGGSALVGLSLPMAAGGCGEGCSPEQMQLGYVVAVALPILLALVTIVTTIAFLRLRRVAYWVPLLGTVAVGLGLLLGSWISLSAVPRLLTF
ncbi:hypothetical protein SAMN04489834_0571 [Microterricola viridarii]|uniref:Uncharacterized protein n=1 Tax=Microterricola viridarii TaxID=412690 RepID=A0A1H1N6I7_9MICO|nr:hypothetical protein SAMN04489834_0571 [Microterricola viridarii]